MPRIRPFRQGDEAALARICLQTGDAGADATGIFDDDALLADVFALPYAERHPDFAFVVENEMGSAIGYTLGTPDTEAFETWFATEWWPQRVARYRRPGNSSGHAGVLAYADGRGPGAARHGARYPAHLHIDLLPEAQGRGWGRKLIATQLDRFRSAGVERVHLVASAKNVGALAFYDRLGFERLPSDEGSQAFGMNLARA